MTVVMLFVMSYNTVKKEDNLSVASALLIQLTLAFVFDIPVLLSYLIARFPEKRETAKIKMPCLGCSVYSPNRY